MLLNWLCCGWRYCRFPGAMSILICCAWGCSTATRSGENDEADAGSRARVQALIYTSQGDLLAAENAFNRAIQLSPADLTNYQNLVLLLRLKGDFKKARSVVEKALAIEPSNIRLLLIQACLKYDEGDAAGAESQLKQILQTDPQNVIAAYKLATLNFPSIDAKQQVRYFRTILANDHANVVPRMRLAELHAREGERDSCIAHLTDIRRILPAFDAPVEEAYQHALAKIKSNEFPAALSFIVQFRRLLEITPAYANDVAALDLPTDYAGHLIFTSSDGMKSSGKPTGTEQIQYTDVSASLDLPTFPVDPEDCTLAVDYREEDGSFRIYASYVPKGSDASQRIVVRSVSGRFVDDAAETTIAHDARERAATFLDYDNDGYRDLFITTSSGNILYQNHGDSRFERINNDVLKKSVSGHCALGVDLDQDGDLDYYVGTDEKNAFYRNNGDGTFAEAGTEMQLALPDHLTRSVDFADFDADGDLDLVVANQQSGPRILSNQRRGRFEDNTTLAFQENKFTGTIVSTGDYNNDGLTDIMVGGESGFELLNNSAAQRFTSDPGGRSIRDALTTFIIHDLTFLDFDNDGYLDILIAGDDQTGRGLRLFRNNGTGAFSDASQILPAIGGTGYRIQIADFNFDGDEDIFVLTSTGVKLLRNDGGSLNNYVQVQLLGLSYGSSKNNRLGIGAQVELKAGNLYQLKTVKRPNILLGVGARDSIETLRIIWPNGVPQVVVDPTLKERMVEEAKLKGSCPFLYTWNGSSFAFVKDMMWRSVLGMPLAINGNDTLFAFSDASKEYLLIPGEALKPVDGKYQLRITEELWETVYFDQAQLIAVDHPDTTDIFVNEAFLPPPFPGREVHQVSRGLLPLTAIDEKGNDVLDAVREYDFNFASTFNPDKYQGLTEEHHLILDLGEAARTNQVKLYLRGWTFPGDASTSMAMAQSTTFRSHQPVLQVINSSGKWQTVIDDLGFPMGKDKMVIADLSRRFLHPRDRRIRIVTNMQIYWDHIFFTNQKTEGPLRMHDLAMSEANLNYRGYSATYRKGGPFGPHWFDYESVTTGQQWRDLTGYYTRYGDVKPLLSSADDMYIIANSGDEITISFDATRVPALPNGWKRDFLIYSVGWVKDGDLNTAHGQTVLPLPFHAMPSYPYGRNVKYPDDAAHRNYMKEYNTRKVNTDQFVNALKP